MLISFLLPSLCQQLEAAETAKAQLREDQASFEVTNKSVMFVVPTVLVLVSTSRDKTRRLRSGEL